MRRPLSVLIVACAALLCATALLQPGAPRAEEGQAPLRPNAGKAKVGKAKVGKAKVGKIGAKAKDGRGQRRERPEGPPPPGGVMGALRGKAEVARPEDALIFSMVRKGRVRSAMPQVRERLDADPDNADLHASLAVLCGAVGELSCALSASRFALGSEAYPRELLQVEANALRADGQGRAAAARRRELIWQAEKPAELAKLYALAARDQREAGAWAEAADDLARAEASLPESEFVLREGVFAAIAAHDLDEADWLLWLRRRADAPWTAEDIEAELAFGLAAQDTERLAAAPTPRTGDLSSRPALAAARARALAATGDLATAQGLLSRAGYQMWGEVHHVELLLAGAVVSEAAGEPAAAQGALQRAAAIAPRHPDWRRWGQAPPRP